MKLDKVIKMLGKEAIAEIDSNDNDNLPQVITNAEQAMQQVQQELEANPKYQELKDSLAALTAGKREVYARQRAIIAYCLHILAKEE